MQLFHHATSEDGPRPLGPGISPEAKDKIMRLSLRFPSLMYALLGHAALHLSRIKPEQSKSWEVQATGLQSASIALFKEIQIEQDADARLAAFIFSTVTGKSVLYHALSSPLHNFDTIVESFAEFLRIQLGIPAVIGLEWMAMQEDPSLRNILTSFHTSWQNLEATGGHAHLSYLDGMIDAARLNDECKRDYKEAVRDLSLCYCAKELADSLRGIYAWPTRLKSSFADELSERRPEALVILAHYAVLIERHTGIWLLGCGGRFVIQSINDHLGNRWHDWMKYPLSYIAAKD